MITTETGLRISPTSNTLTPILSAELNTSALPSIESPKIVEPKHYALIIALIVLIFYMVKK
jgi:hypothetical protein